MTVSTTMTIRVSHDMNEKLERLAQDTHRSKSHLAAEAVSSYVEQQLEIIEGIACARRDVEAGRWVDHDHAMAEVDSVIGSVRSGGFEATRSMGASRAR